MNPFRRRPTLTRWEKTLMAILDTLQTAVTALDAIVSSIEAETAKNAAA